MLPARCFRAGGLLRGWNHMAGGDSARIGTAERRPWLVPALAMLVVLLFIVSLGVGPVRLSPGEVFAALFADPGDGARIIVMEIRLPRAILAVAIGGVLALGGASLQGLLRNPLAEPSLFGAPQVAALAAVTTITLGFNDVLSWGLPVAAILGALISVCLLVAIAGRDAGLLLLILSGLAVSSLAGAGTVLAIIAQGGKRLAVGDRVLGKTIVRCKDTPGFIANRIGIYWSYVAMSLAFKHGLTVELGSLTALGSAPRKT